MKTAGISSKQWRLPLSNSRRRLNGAGMARRPATISADVE